MFCRSLLAQALLEGAGASVAGVPRLAVGCVSSDPSIALALSEESAGLLSLLCFHTEHLTTAGASPLLCVLSPHRLIPSLQLLLSHPLIFCTSLAHIIFLWRNPNELDVLPVLRHTQLIYPVIHKQISSRQFPKHETNLALSLTSRHCPVQAFCHSPQTQSCLLKNLAFSSARKTGPMRTARTHSTSS